MLFLRRENFVWTDTIYDLLSIPEEKSNKIENYLWAHNGFSFDWLYFYEPLTKDLDGFKIVGDSSRTKCFKGNGLFLYDFKNIYPEKLSQLA
jgi:hypothetical protein